MLGPVVRVDEYRKTRKHWSNFFYSYRFVFFMPFLQQTGSSQLIDYTIMLLSLTVVQSTPFLKVDKDGIGYIRYRIQIRNKTQSDSSLNFRVVLRNLEIHLQHQFSLLNIVKYLKINNYALYLQSG